MVPIGALCLGKAHVESETQPWMNKGSSVYADGYAIHELIQ